MRDLLIVGGGLFGSLAAAYARRKGINVLVFDNRKVGAASPAAAGLFKEQWAGRKFHSAFQSALPLLENLYEIRTVSFHLPDGTMDRLLHVPPRLILEQNPKPTEVTAIGDGWLEAQGHRYEGWVYIAAGIWSGQFQEGLKLTGKAGTAFGFPGEQTARFLSIGYGQQAIAFVRDPGMTYFSDGTAEIRYTDEHEQVTRQRALSLGLGAEPIERWHGFRPYTPGGPVFQQLGVRTWLATGGRKLGTVLGAALGRRLVENELKN